MRIIVRIERLRRDHKWSARRIALELAAQGTTVSVRTVGRHLAHLGLNRRRFLDPTGQNNRAPRRIVARWPGHMVHLDVKKVGVIPDGGWRVRGRGSEQAKQVERAKNTGTGKPGTQRSYTYLHSAVDGFSRLAYTEALPDEKAVTAIGFTHRARAFFAAHGIDHIHRIVTDNGSCYRAHDFAKVLLGARHQRITPYTPRHNGKVERYQRILGDEFLYARVWTSEQQRTDALTVWNVHYNYHRPHTAAGNRPPAARLHTGVTNVLASYTTRHCVHVQYYDPDKDGLILDAVRPLLEQLRPHAERLHLARHWRRGPHVRLFVKTDPRTWGHVVRPRIDTVLGEYLKAHPSTFVPDLARELAQHRLLAATEREDGPLTPWLPDNTVHEHPYDPRLHVLRSPETAELMAAFAADCTSLLFDLLAHARAGRSSKELLALELMLATSATSATVRPPITRSFVSYRSHAEGYLHACADPGAVREAFDDYYRTHRQSFVDRTRAVLASPTTPFAGRWAALCRDYARRVQPLVEQGLVFPPIAADPPATPRPAPLHALMFGNRAFREGIFANPGFLSYRFLLNCTHLQISRLGLTPYERMRTCHAAANAVEEVHGISAMDIVRTFVDNHPNTPAGR